MIQKSYDISSVMVLCCFCLPIVHREHDQEFNAAVKETEGKYPVCRNEHVFTGAATLCIYSCDVDRPCLTFLFYLVNVEQRVTTGDDSEFTEAQLNAVRLNK